MPSTLRNKIKQVIEQSDTGLERAFDLFIQALILVSVVGFCVQTLPDLKSSTRDWLGTIEVIAVAIFTVEYILRIYVSDRPFRFIFSFYGLVDFIAIVPFYLSLGIDLRALRAVRFFRLFQMFKLLRYSNAINRYTRAIRDIREELAVYLFASAMILFFASAGIHFFEGQTQPEAFGSVFHCMWWAIVTLTTVGYGDVYPVTVGGKIFTGIILMLGLGMVAVPTGLFASALTKDKDGGDDSGS